MIMRMGWLLSTVMYNTHYWAHQVCACTFGLCEDLRLVYNVANFDIKRWGGGGGGRK